MGFISHLVQPSEHRLDGPGGLQSTPKVSTGSLQHAPVIVQPAAVLVPLGGGGDGRQVCGCDAVQGVCGGLASVRRGVVRLSGTFARWGTV